MTILEAMETAMVSRFELLRQSAKEVMAEAHVQIKAAELVGDGVTAKNMLARHTRAAKVLNALQKAGE